MEGAILKGDKKEPKIQSFSKSSACGYLIRRQVMSVFEVFRQ